MKKLICSLSLTALCMLGMTACTTETHYDSVSTNISINVPNMPYDGSMMTIRERFQFDRDLSSISSMTLHEAWLSSPPDVQGSDEDARTDDAVLPVSLSLDIVKTISISLVESENSPSVVWLVVPSSQLKGKDAIFSDFNVGDLRQYMDSYQQLELEVEIALEPYHVMRYWRDVCGMSANCTINLPLSMQFKMED